MGEPVPLIYNPASGGGRGKKRYEEVALMMQERGLEFIPMPTGYPNHATHLARELGRAGHKVLYVLGGDGTISEAANGVLDLPVKQRPVLGCIPSGTGNDFLRDFGCLTREEALDRIEAGKIRSVDAGRITYQTKGGETRQRFFVNIFGFGFAADVVELTNARYKWMGAASYSAAVLTKLATLRNSKIVVHTDDTSREINGAMVMVCNSIHTGGAMKMAPEADATDGWFDVVTVEDVGRMGILKLFPKIFEGKHVDHPNVNVIRAKHISLDPETASSILADGEVYGRTPASVEMMEGALKILN